jgi:hypothetical protein
MSAEKPPTFVGPPFDYPPIAVPLPSPALGQLDTVGPTPVSDPPDIPYADVTSDDVTVPYTPPTPGDNVGQYDHYALTTHFVEDNGVRAVPVCGPAGTPMRPIRVHGGAFYKVVTFTARRFVSLPQLPSSAPANNNEMLISRRVSPATPGDMPDGNKVWTVTGQYVYALRVPPTESDTLTCGVSPLALLGGPNRPSNDPPIRDGDLPPSVWNGTLVAPAPVPAAAGPTGFITL